MPQTCKSFAAFFCLLCQWPCATLQSMSNQDDSSADKEGLAEKASDPKVVDFTSRKAKRSQDNSASRFVGAKKWDISYKSQKWGSGNGDKVSPNSQGNSGFVRGGGKQPFFNFSKIPPFVRFLAMAFVIVHALLTLIVPQDSVAKIYTVFAFVPAVFSGENGVIPLLSLLSPVTYMFLHADWMHVVFNTLMMVVFGTVIERAFGARICAAFFFVGGLAGALIFWGLNVDGAWPLMGASAGISALFGALILHMDGQMRRVSFAKRPRASVMIIIWIVIMVVTGLMGGGHIAWPSHIAGFLSGLALYEGMRRGYVRF